MVLNATGSNENEYKLKQHWHVPRNCNINNYDHCNLFIVLLSLYFTLFDLACAYKIMQSLQFP